MMYFCPLIVDIMNIISDNKLKSIIYTTGHRICKEAEKAIFATNQRIV